MEGSPTPNSPRMLGDYMVLHEFNYDDYAFQNRKTGVHFPVLSKVSNSKVPGGSGLCSYYCVHDVCQTRFRILQATLPSKKEWYHNHFFRDTLSLSQLKDTNYGKVVPLLTYLVHHGLTTESEYFVRAKRVPGSNMKDYTGCRKFKFNAVSSWKDEDLHPTVELMESSEGDDSIEGGFGSLNRCINHIRRFGPIIGVYEVPGDHDLLGQVPFFESKDSSRTSGPSGTNIRHRLMIIGYGLALHLPTQRKIPYYVCQDNRGTEMNPICRMPCSSFAFAYAPVLYDQCDLAKFSNSDSSVMRFVKKEFLEPGVRLVE